MGIFRLKPGEIPRQRRGNGQIGIGVYNLIHHLTGCHYGTGNQRWTDNYCGSGITSDAAISARCSLNICRLENSQRPSTRRYSSSEWPYAPR
jgi:hypothetical protein